MNGEEQKERERERERKRERERERLKKIIIVVKRYICDEACDCL